MEKRILCPLLYGSAFQALPTRGAAECESPGTLQRTQYTNGFKQTQKTHIYKN